MTFMPLCAILKKMAFFRKFFKKTDRHTAPYEQEKRISQSDDVAARLKLAQSEKTHQEILYYLGQHDPDPAVRQAVARNSATPLHASPVLAGDRNEDVRLALAERLVTLLPGLLPEEQSQIYSYAVQALAMLALDKVVKIRRALSSALKDYAQTPPKIALQLARDIERSVSEPILRYCVALADEDLLDILATHPEGWAVEAIAGRETVSADISAAVIAADNPEAGVILLENQGAEIGTDLIEVIVEKARLCPEWQKPASLHRALSTSVAEELASFANMSVRELLTQRKDFDADTVEAITAIFNRRLRFLEEGNQTESVAERVALLGQEGALDEAMVSDAIAAGNSDFVCEALAFMAGTERETIDKVMDAKAAKAIVSLAWRAGLPMRMALRLQREVAGVAPTGLIYPRGGTDYPLSRKELIWQLEFLGLTDIPD